MNITIIPREQFIEILKNFADNVITFVIYLLILIILLKLVDKFINKIFTKIINSHNDFDIKKQVATIKNLVKSIINTIVIVILVLNFLAKFSIDIRPLLTAAGVVGVAVGFAARRFVEDIIMGIFILLEGQIRVGDEVTIDSYNGTVEKVTLKMVIIRNMSGHVHYIRNGMINVITNKTREFASPVVDVSVAYNSDIDYVIEILKNVASSMRANEAYAPYMLNDLEVFGLDKFGDSAINIRVRLRTEPTRQWFIMREFNKHVKIAFDNEGIEIPFPQQDVHIKKN